MSTEHKNIKLTYYAFMKEKCGVDDELINTSATTVQDLYDELQSKYKFDRLLVIVNIKILIKFGNECDFFDLADQFNDRP